MTEDFPSQGLSALDGVIGVWSGVLEMKSLRNERGSGVIDVDWMDESRQRQGGYYRVQNRTQEVGQASRRLVLGPTS